MIGTNFVDEVDCGSFFDHIDDLLDFSNEDLEIGLGGIDSNSFPSIWTSHSESLPPSDSVFTGNTNSDLAAQLSVPYEDIVQLEWLSNFVEDSFSGGSLTINNKEDSSSINKKDSSSPHNQFHSSSPVSVLESSSSYSGDKAPPCSPEPVGPPSRCGHGRGRARSKRPRPATFNPRMPIQLISPTSSVNENEPTGQRIIAPKVFSDSENVVESRLVIKLPRQAIIASEHKKKKKIKLSVPKAPVGEIIDQDQTTPSQYVRKCMHCEITKTPQWRAGPTGPKTLCNACGVRYKSGRLFPEYRPAASPTFVPSLHSNSHKKVVEMRSKTEKRDMSSETVAPLITDLPELIPNDGNLALNYI